MTKKLVVTALALILAVILSIVVNLARSRNLKGSQVNR